MGIEKREGREVYTHATHTRCIVEFHSDGNPRGEAIILGAENGPHARLGHLISVETDKTIGAASGTFSITVKKPQSMGRQQSLLRIWQDPEDVWVRIYWVVEGQKIHVMTGLLDTFNENMVRDQNGKRMEVYTITGRDFGKVFETMQLWVNVFDVGPKAPASLVRYFNEAMPKAPGVGTPGAWIKWWLEGWVANGGLAEVQWQLPHSLGGGSFYDALNLDNIQDMDTGNGLLADATIYNPDLDTGFGKLWDKMVEYSNDVLNELWVDLEHGDSTGNRPMSVYLRERPFPTHGSTEKWSQVQQHVLERHDVFGRNVSKGGPAARFNYWMLATSGRLVGADERSLVMGGRIDGASQGLPGGVPIWNQESIVKHGVRKWEQSTMFLSGMIAASSPAFWTWPKVLANWLRRCHDWYAPLPMLLSGTITTTRPLPEIHVGQRLLEKRDEGNCEYYIEGVKNAWHFAAASRTTLTVTYGKYEDEDLLGYIYQEMSLSQVDCSMQGLQGTVLEGVDLTQSCRFTPQSAAEADIGAFSIDHGGEGFEISGDAAAPDLSALEAPGKSLIEEGASALSTKQADPKMIPRPDIANEQAFQLSQGNAGATLRKPPGADFGADQLKRGEDPFVGWDDDLNDDPIGGLVPE